MANDNKHNIWIQLADVKAMPLSVNKAEEANYHEAEKLVNTLWDKWMKRFNENSSSHEVLARVAFQFARLYLEAYAQNKAANELLQRFEAQLDEFVVKQ